MQAKRTPPGTRHRTVGAIAITLLLALGVGCSRKPTTSASPDIVKNPAAPVVPLRGTEASMTAVRFLEDRIKSDPDDLVALNKLANYYLQLYRETYDVAYLGLALRSARSSLGVLVADQNLAGLLVLAQAEYATHDFVAARDHAKQLTEFQPRKGYGFQVLGDSLLELGAYEEAVSAYDKMKQFDEGSVATETRLAHLAMLRGDAATAQRLYASALAAAKTALVPASETIAWCHWQIGETYFQSGDYRGAEAHYREALAAYPDYVRAVASLARVRAAQGDRASAIEHYEHAVRIVPDPQFVAALGDLYKLSGRDQDAASQYSLVEKIAHLNELNGSLYNRQLAVFYADHELKPEEGYANALREYGTRRDIYGADAVAWTALKAGKIAEAQATIKEALRLGTKDARIFYHAGMIARAAGDQAGARDYLKRALELNAQFDPWQAPIAMKALEA